jgi:HEAT repeat protein
MTHNAPAAPVATGSPGRTRIHVRTLVLVVAGVALALGAWRFLEENNDAERSWTSLQLRSLAQRRDPERRRWAVEALAQARGQDLPVVAPALIAALRDADPTVRRASARSLADAIRKGAFEGYGGVAAEVASATAALISALGDGDAGVRAEAARALGDLRVEAPPRGVTRPASRPGPAASVGPDPAVAVPALLGALRDPEPSVRAAAALALRVTAPKDGDAPPALLAAFVADPSPEVRGAAAHALGRRWANEDVVFLALLDRFPAASPANQGAIAGALAQLGGTPAPALPGLIEALKSENPWARRGIAEALARLGPGAKAALPALARVAREELREGWRFSAAEAVAAIDPDSAEAQALIAPLVELVRSDDGRGSGGAAALALGRFGPAARSAIPALRAAMQGRDSNLRTWAALALDRITP